MTLLALALLLSCSSSAQITAEGLPADGIRWGQAVLALPDLDGDGALDFAVGAPAATIDGERGAGMVLVISGTTGHRIARWSFGEGYGMGATLARGADADGDGVDEVLVGAGSHGRTEVWSCVKSERLFFFEALSDRVHSVGDVDSDGTGDYLVTGPEAGGFFSGKDGSALEAFALGSTMSKLLTVGDLDGDGVVDGVLAEAGKLVLSAAPVGKPEGGAAAGRTSELFPKASQFQLRDGDAMLASGDQITAALGAPRGASSEESRSPQFQLSVLASDGKTSVMGFTVQPNPVLSWRVEVKGGLGSRSGKRIHDVLTPLDDLNGDGVGDLLLTTSPTFGVFLGAFSGANGESLWQQNLMDVGVGTMVAAGRVDDADGDGAADLVVGFSQGYVIGVPVARPLGIVSLLSSSNGEVLHSYAEDGRGVLEAFLDEICGKVRGEVRDPGWLLVVDGSKAEIKDQIQELARDYQGASERGVMVIDLIGELPTVRIGDLRSRPRTEDLRRHFGLDGESFRMVLVDKDGVVIHRYDGVTVAKEIWETVDGEL